MDFDIRKFDEYREDNRLEVKSATGGLPNSLWESYSSMANCYGGMILLGIKEKEDGSLETTGLRNAHKLRSDFWNLAHNSQKVSVNLLTDDDVVMYDVGGDVVVAINVPIARREDKPVFINGDLFNGTFRRDGEGDYHCSKAEVKSMLRDQTEETSDMKVLEDMDLSDLSADTVRLYRSRHANYRNDHVWEDLPDDEYLERIGAAKRTIAGGKLHPTAAGLLMFGEEFRILYEYPEYFLDYREVLDPSIRWTDRLQSSAGTWTGNLFDFFFGVSTRLTRDLKVPFKLDGITRIDDTPVHKALREALVNCLVNADFFVPRGVVVRKEQDRIIFENPGSIRTGKDQMLRGGISDPRNKALMKMFNLIGIGERAGSGVPDIFAVWDSQGWVAPRVEEQYRVDRTILILPLVSDDSSGRKRSKAVESGRNIIGAKADIIKALSAAEEPLNSAAISNSIGLGKTRTNELIRELVESGHVIAEGATRSRRYRLAE